MSIIDTSSSQLATAEKEPATVSNTNIISFPNSHVNPRRQPVQDMEEIRLQKCLNHIGESLSEISSLLTDALMECGFEVQSETDVHQDIAFAIESIKSVMFKYYGLEFYTQKIAERIYTETEPGAFHRILEPVIENDVLKFIPTTEESPTT